MNATQPLLRRLKLVLSIIGLTAVSTPAWAIMGISPLELHEGGMRFIPLVVVCLPFLLAAFVIGVLFFCIHRRNKMTHETLRAMIDRGMPVTPELVASLRPTAGASFGNRNRAGHSNGIRGPLMLIAIGIGLVILVGIPGWILVLIGLAGLIATLWEGSQSPPPPFVPPSPPSPPPGAPPII